MSHLPPKLRNLDEWIENGNSSKSNVSREVWDIGVPVRKSLPCSIVLSVLSESDADLPNHLRKLTGSEEEMEEIKKKKSIDEVTPEEIKNFFSEFNPFQYRYTSLNQLPKINVIVDIFELRLNRCAQKMQTKKDVWNDDLKLRAAAQLLQTTIDVYFPEDVEARRFKRYPEIASNTEKNIILFQYENKKAGGDIKNDFHFALSQQFVSHLKLDTPEKISKKTNDENIIPGHVSLPPPKLRNLNEWLENGNSITGNVLREVWEIGVPAKKSLSWSIVLSVFLDSDENPTSLLRKLTGSEEEMKEIKEKMKLMEEVTPEEIKIFLGKFNPFKNRYTSFVQSPKISEIVRIFDFRLKRYASGIKTEKDVWNDDLKLKAAAMFLNTTIDVYFPDDTEARKFKSYAGTASNTQTSIILFQYENKKHNIRKETINVFYFAMSQKYAHHLKLDALKHFLRKAKVENFLRGEVQNLMLDSGAHGQAFLPTIIRSNCIDILPDIYRSPYVAFKLSEAGFETNPIAGIKDNQSALCYASENSDPSYLRLLYDYASNCRHLFDRSARRADDDVIENLKRIKRIIERDISEVEKNSEVPDFKVNVLKQIRKFAEYQTEVANNLKELIGSKLNSDKLQFRKSIIISILEHFLNYFYYESMGSGNLSFQLEDYCTFPEYYEYTDNFSFLSFFDNFFQLRICSGLKEENVVLNTEWNMFQAMMSNKYFPKFSVKNALVDQHNSKDCDENILRYIPLFYRNALGEEVKRFLEMLKHSSDANCLKEEIFSKDSVSMSQIVDELILQRLNKYIEAVFEISPRSDGIKAVLVVERALQVLGESIKPPSSNTSIVSFLLRSSLDSTLQIDLIRIRNELSKYISNDVYGRVETEKECSFFEGIKEEFKSIQKVFQAVNFTQNFRIKESLINIALQGLEKELDVNTYKELNRKCKIYENQKIKKYGKYYDSCVKLLYDSFTDIQKALNSRYCKLQELFDQLKSIEYLIICIKKIKHERYLDDLTIDIQSFIKENVEDDKLEMKSKGLKQNDENQMLIQITKSIDPLLIKCINTIEEHNSVQQTKLSAPFTGQFFNRLKTGMFTCQEIEEILEAVKEAVSESEEAIEEVKKIFQKKLYKSVENIDELLRKILVPFNKLPEIRKCFENRKEKVALKYLKTRVSENTIEKEVKEMLETGSVINGYALTLITKIAFQTYFPSKIYTSVSLLEKTSKKLESFVTKKANFLLMRLKSLKDILIDEDKEIRGTNKWGRSEPIKYHLKFLMRQRYQREKSICASLEMAYFDCMNIFCQQSKDNDGQSSDDCLRSFYEKSNDLYTGINLRNILSHRQNIPETVGNILDEEDFPSEMIDKMYQLIGDTEAIEAIFHLFRIAGVLTEEEFITAIENEGFGEHMTLVEEIKKCSRWKEYLFLFPFIRV